MQDDVRCLRTAGTSVRRWGRRGGVIGWLALGAVVLPLSSPAAQEVAYTLTPTLTYVDWNDELGLEQAYLWGGRFGFDFGRFVTLRGFYLTRSDVETRLGELTLRDTLGQPLPEQQLDLQHYGGSLLLAFGTGDVVPIATGGGSIVRFEPEQGDASRQVALHYGGGLRFGRPNSTQIELLAKIWRFRLNRFRLAPDTARIPVDTADPAGDRLWRNVTVSLGVNIPFGERRFTDQPPELRWSRASFPIELFAGRLNFDDETGLREQELVGARAGVDFGRLVGVRGYYWRGTNDDFDDFQEIESWGGEAQFALNAGTGIAPFLLFGAGQLNFKDDYRDIAGNPRDDRTMLIFGGGVRLGITDRIRVHLAARDHLFSAGELEDVAQADELQHNWLYSAGLLFGIGGGYRAALEREQREREERERIAQERARMERLAAEMERERRGDTVIVVAPERDRDFVSDRTVEIPAPERGELYVRYGPEQEPERPGQPGMQPGMRPGMRPGMMGPEGAMLREQVREVVRQELDRHMMMMGMMRQPGQAQPGAPGQQVGPTDVEMISQRVAAMLQEQLRMERDTMLILLRQELAAARMPTTLEERQALLMQIDTLVAAAVARELDRRAREGRLVVPAQPAEPGAVVEAEAPSPTLTPRAWYAYTGVGWDGTTQMLLGLRTDLGAPWARHPDIHLVPEFALGVFGGNTTWLLAGNLQYRFPQFTFGGDWNLMPFIGAGLGLLNFQDEVGTREGFEAVLNFGYGLRFPLSAFGLSTAQPLDAFIEHQGIDVFSLNRVLLGVRAQF